MRHTAGALLLLAALGTLAACSDSGDGASPPPASAPPASAKAAPTPEKSPREKSPPPKDKPGPAPSLNALMGAKKPSDGRDLDACHDGRCHVSIRAGDRIELDDVPPLQVTTIGKDQITIVQSTSGGGMFMASVGVGGYITFNDISMQPLAIDPGSSANLKIGPA